MSRAVTEAQRIAWVEHRQREGRCYCLACWQAKLDGRLAVRDMSSAAAIRGES